MITGEQFARDAINVTDAREQSGVTGDTAHRVGVFVVSLTSQKPPAQRTNLRRGNHFHDWFKPARAHERDVDEISGTQTKAAENLVTTKAREVHAANLLDQ